MGNNGFHYYPLLTSPTCRWSKRQHKQRTCSQKPASDHWQPDSFRTSASACHGLSSRHNAFVTAGKLQSKHRTGQYRTATWDTDLILQVHLEPRYIQIYIWIHETYQFIYEKIRWIHSLYEFIYVFIWIHMNSWVHEFMHMNSNMQIMNSYMNMNPCIWIHSIKSEFICDFIHMIS